MDFQNSSLKVVPDLSQIEVVVIGKGVGECILVHVGDHRYLVVDTFINNETGNSVALDYLYAIGLDASNIDLLICTHWHKDHTEGLTQLIEMNKDIIFVTYEIITKDKFVEFLEFDKTNKDGSTKEFNKVLDMILNREVNPSNIRLASFNTNLKNYCKGELTHEKRVDVYSLSPQHIENLDYVTNLQIPKVGDYKYTYPNDNDISIVTWIEIGDLAILLGGDLENKGSIHKGWKAIVNNHSISFNKASIFKVPHHGSSNGHNEDVWTKLVSNDVLSAATVFNRKDLPSDLDVERIKSRSSHLYVAGARPRRDKELREIEREIRHLRSKASIKKINSSIGVTRFRTDANEISWITETYGSVAKH